MLIEKILNEFFDSKKVKKIAIKARILVILILCFFAIFKKTENFLSKILKVILLIFFLILFLPILAIFLTFCIFY